MARTFLNNSALLCVAAAVAFGLPLDGAASDSLVMNDRTESGELRFPEGFMFGSSSAATQIEENNTRTDWWWYGASEAEGGLAKLKNPVGNAAMGYNMTSEDIYLMKTMGLNSYRFSIEWGRVWPNGPNAEYDRDALAHYRQQIIDMRAAGVTPMVTIHHFSNPIWVEDFVHANATATGPKDCTTTDTNLCGWAGPNQAAIIAALVKHTELLATELGDVVDNWCTINEPVNYIMAGWGLAAFPPGHSYLMDGHMSDLMDVFRGFLEAHSQMYDVLKTKDTISAANDGVAANVGNTLSVAEWVPTRANQFSTDPVDVAAADNVDYVYNHFFTQSILDGTFDADWSRNASTMEAHPDWKGKLDFVGLQYYFRTGVTGSPALLAPVRGTPCMPGSGLDVGSCLPAPEDPNHWIPSMGYEYWENGTYNILTAYKEKYPGLPTIVTESGISSNNGVRRSEHIVRNLEQIHRAITDGADVRGYFHWSLTDNFEWAEGYDPHFGLYRMADPYNGDYSRVATAGAFTYKQIMQNNGTVSVALREKYGGYGPMTPETEKAGDFPNAQPMENPTEKPSPSVQGKPESEPEAKPEDKPAAGGDGAAEMESCVDADTITLEAYMGDCSGEPILTSDITTDGNCLNVTAMGMPGSAQIERVDETLIGKVYMGAGCMGDPLVVTGPLEAGDVCNAAAPASVKVSCAVSTVASTPVKAPTTACKSVSLKAWMGDCVGDAILETKAKTDGTCLDVMAMGMQGSARVTLNSDNMLVGDIFMGAGCPASPMVTIPDMKRDGSCTPAAPASVEVVCA